MGQTTGAMGRSRYRAHAHGPSANRRRFPNNAFKPISGPRPISTIIRYRMAPAHFDGGGPMGEGACTQVRQGTFPLTIPRLQPAWQKPDHSTHTRRTATEVRGNRRAKEQQESKNTEPNQEEPQDRQEEKKTQTQPKKKQNPKKRRHRHQRPSKPIQSQYHQRNQKPKQKKRDDGRLAPCFAANAQKRRNTAVFKGFFD